MYANITIWVAHLHKQKFMPTNFSGSNYMQMLIITMFCIGSSSSVPTLKDLMSAVAAKIPAKWRKVGIQLDIPVAALDDIQLQVGWRPDSNIDAFELVLGKLKSLHFHKYTWSTIIKALEAHLLMQWMWQLN